MFLIAEYRRFVVANKHMGEDGIIFAQVRGISRDDGKCSKRGVSSAEYVCRSPSIIYSQSCASSFWPSIASVLFAGIPAGCLKDLESCDTK